MYMYLHFLNCHTLRSELDKAVAMLGTYEQTREEKEMEIRHLQVQTHTVSPSPEHSRQYIYCQ